MILFEPRLSQYLLDEDFFIENCQPQKNPKNLMHFMVQNDRERLRFFEQFTMARFINPSAEIVATGRRATCRERLVWLRLAMIRAVGAAVC